LLVDLFELEEFLSNTYQNEQQSLKALKTAECHIAQCNIWRVMTSQSSTKWFTVVLMTLMLADRANEFHACYKSRKPFAVFNKPSPALTSALSIQKTTATSQARF
jgi:hypothetical protein